MTNIGDLTKEEQAHVRAALQFLRQRCGGWGPLAKSLHTMAEYLSKMAQGTKKITPSIAFRVARFAKVGVDDVLTGKFPAPGTCPYCGHRPDESEG